MNLSQRLRYFTLFIVLCQIESFSFRYLSYAPQITHRSISTPQTVWKSLLLAKGSDEDNDGEEMDVVEKTTNKKDPTERMTLIEYAEKEREAARKLSNRLLLPDRIGRAVNASLYAFVILGFVLNFFGFAYVRNSDGSLMIGTMETRQFQEEMNRTMKSSATKGTPNQE